jgi:CDP-diacylglycerol--glycerol-3-phosphate 3-phosphatidyltransferase
VKLLFVNLLTGLRLVLGLLLVALIVMNHVPAAAVTLCLIYASDILDGFLARKWSVATRGGAIFDLTADVLFVFMSYGALVISGGIPRWFFLAAVLKFAEFAATSVFLTQAGVPGEINAGKSRWSPVFDSLGRASGIMFMAVPLAVIGMFSLLDVNLATGVSLCLELLIAVSAIMSSVYRVWLCIRVTEKCQTKYLRKDYSDLKRVI